MPKHLTPEANRHRVRCPLRDKNGIHTVVGPVEWLEFLSWNRKVVFVVPRICLEFLGLKGLDAIKVGKDHQSPYWISKEDSSRIVRHEHTRFG